MSKLILTLLALSGKSTVTELLGKKMELVSLTEIVLDAAPSTFARRSSTLQESLS